MSHIQKLNLFFICLSVSTIFTACLKTRAMQDRLNGCFYVYKFTAREATKMKSATFANSVYKISYYVSV